MIYLKYNTFRVKFDTIRIKSKIFSVVGPVCSLTDIDHDEGQPARPGAGEGGQKERGQGQGLEGHRGEQGDDARGQEAARRRHHAAEAGGQGGRQGRKGRGGIGKGIMSKRSSISNWTLLSLFFTQETFCRYAGT